MKRQANKGMVLYQEVLQKNFQIIQTFLNKFPLIFKKQDFFEDAIKKLNQKLMKHEQDQEKIRQQLQLTSNLLQKKILTTKENAARNSRSSARISQQLIPLQQRKNSIFKVGSAFKDQRDSHFSHFSKQKNEMLSQLDKKQQQNTKRLDQLQQQVDKLQQRIHFLSVLQSKNQEKLDKLSDQKVDIISFNQLQSKFHKEFENSLGKMTQQKYFLGSKLIDKKVSSIQVGLSRQIQKLSFDVRNQLIKQLQKKAALSDFKEQLGQVKQVIEKMVQQSVQSFASKQETKKSLLLFEKKFIKLELVLQQMLNQALKTDSESHIVQCLTLPGRRQKQVMNGFGRRRRIDQK